MRKVETLLLLCVIGSYAFEAVWCPLYDWETGIYYVRDDSAIPQGNPDATQAGSGSAYFNSLDDLIDEALQEAAARGIEVIDLPFLFKEKWISHSSYWNQTRRISTKWMERVDKYNANNANNQFKVRLRFKASATTMYAFNFEYLQHASPSQAIAGLPTSISDWYAFDKNGNESVAFLDLGNTTLRNAMLQFLRRTMDEVSGYSNITIDEVTLDLDAGGESSLFPYIDGDHPLGFTGIGSYDAGASIHERTRWLLDRQDILHDTYKAFADAVHRKGSSIKAAVFYQVWVFDNLVRGAFDYYRLFKETGLDCIHLTMLPSVLPVHSGKSFSQQLDLEHACMQTSIASSMVRHLSSAEGRNVIFDTEFSWAHYPNSSAETREYVVNNGVVTNLTYANAEAFRYQAEAGRLYDCDGMVYCNWSRYDMAEGLPRARYSGEKNSTTYYSWSPFDNTYSNRKTHDFASPRDPWPLAWWTDPTTTLQGSAWDDIYTQRAVTDIADMDPLGGSITTAIYLNTVGQIEYEVDGASGNCAAPAFFSWIDEFGITPTHERVDFITDQMLWDEPGIFDQYDVVYLPHEFSSDREIGTRAKVRFRGLSQANRNKIRWQKSSTQSSGFGTYDEWMNQLTGTYPEPTGLVPVLNLLLLD